MSISFAVTLGGAGGAVVLLGIFIGVIWFYLLQRRKHLNKNSDTGSSDPSTIVEVKGRGLHSSSVTPPLMGPHEARQFTTEDLDQATNHFDEKNLIGCGRLGLVYKGLLRDGTIVAIKRRAGVPQQEFVEEVAYLSRITHRNLVSLLGYCQDCGYQMLVSEYLPNGSMCSHLYATGKDSASKLEFKQRLSIALGAAKGLCHLHGQQTPTVHSNFKTSNVLVDENFIAKVADAGVSRLLQKIEDAGPSHSARTNVFEDPETAQMGIYTEMSDVYSFGVFLLELLIGQEASHIDSFGSDGSILQWVETHLNSKDMMDHRLGGSFTTEGIKDFIRLTLRCMAPLGKGRPNMRMVVLELDRILEEEITRTTVRGEGSAQVTLGSQLFTAK